MWGQSFVLSILHLPLNDFVEYEMRNSPKFHGIPLSFIQEKIFIAKSIKTWN